MPNIPARKMKPTRIMTAISDLVLRAGGPALWFERPTRLEGSGGLASWLELFCLPLLLALGDRRAEVVAGVERRCHAQLYRDGSWWLDYTRLRVVAVKP